MKRDVYGTPLPSYYNRKLFKSGNASRVQFHLDSKAISLPLVELEYFAEVDMTMYVDEDGWLYLIDNSRTCVYTCADKSGMNEVARAFTAYGGEV